MNKRAQNDLSMCFPPSCVTPIEKMVGDDELDTRVLGEMAADASSFLSSFQWCESIEEAYYGDGIGGIVAVFLFRIVPSRANVDEWLWVVVGDLPSAYLVTDGIRSPYEALAAYTDHREAWVKHARRGQEPPTNVMPVNVPATPEEAERLGVRLKVIREELLPFFRRE